MYKTIWNTALTANDSAAREELGIVRQTYDTTNGYREFKYIQFDNGTGNLTSVANQVVYSVVASFAGAKVTNDVSDSGINFIAGITPVALTDTYYGWMQIRGQATVNTNGDDDIAAGDALIGTSAADGVCNSVAANTAPTNKVLGWALAADVDAANTVLANLTVGA